MNEEEIEIATKLTLYIEGSLNLAESARIKQAINHSEFLQNEIEEILALRKSASKSTNKDALAPSEAQVDTLLSLIRHAPQTEQSKSALQEQRASIRDWVAKFKLQNGNYQIKPIFAHVFLAIFAAQFIITGLLLSQPSASKMSKLQNQPHLITHASPSSNWADFTNAINSKNLQIASVGANNSLILAPKTKLSKEELEKIAKDLEYSGTAQDAVFSDGTYLKRPIKCQTYKNDTVFENRPAASNSNISDFFYNIETIEGTIYGETRKGPSEIKLTNLGSDGGWFSLGSKSPNPNLKDSWLTVMGRFANDLNAELDRDNLPLVRVGLDLVLGNEDAIYPGKIFTAKQNGPLNIKYPASVHNIPGQAKVTGFDLKICGHIK